MRILVADDNPINQKLVYYSLKRYYDIETANNGKEVLTLIQDKSIDLILMDFSMPVMDGAQATEYIRKMEGSREKRIPIIFVTTNDIEKDRRACMELGADDYLVKPVDTDLLLERIRFHLQENLTT